MVRTALAVPVFGVSVRLFTLRVVVTNSEVADRFTVPVNPWRDANVMMDTPTEPGWKTSSDGLAVMLMSGGAAGVT